MQLTIHLRLIVSSRVASNKSPRWPRSLHPISFMCDAFDFPLCAARVAARHSCIAFIFITPSYRNVISLGPALQTSITVNRSPTIEKEIVSQLWKVLFVLWLYITRLVYCRPSDQTCSWGAGLAAHSLTQAAFWLNFIFGYFITEVIATCLFWCLNITASFTLTSHSLAFILLLNALYFKSYLLFCSS